MFGFSLRPQLFSFTRPKPNPKTARLPKHESLSPNHQFCQAI